MSAVTHYHCEICGIEIGNPIHWFLIDCNDDELKVRRWDGTSADARGAHLYCGEAHASVYVSRWLEAASPPSPPSQTSTTPEPAREPLNKRHERKSPVSTAP
jgi:hypothetical protein